jgi:hypothetical protein
VAAVRAGRRGAKMTATCDRACTLFATARVGISGGKPVALKAGAALDAARPEEVALAYPARLRRALAHGRGRRLTVRVAALGLGGPAAAVVRRIALR